MRSEGTAGAGTVNMREAGLVAGVQLGRNLREAISTECKRFFERNLVSQD